MNKKLLRVFSCLIVVLVAGYFLGSEVANAEELKWVGCGITKKAFMKSLANAYEQKTGVKISLEGGGATRGIRDVSNGKADMGGSCRHVTLDQNERKVRLEQVGWDALVVITHPANQVDNITSDQLKGVFDGKITNWKELGGDDMPIKVAVRSGQISGVGLMVRELLYKNPDHEFNAKAIVLKSSGPVEKFVEKERAAIAFTGVSSAKKRDVKMLSINGKSPSGENIASGQYMLYRPLYLVTSKNPTQSVKKFIEFAKSDEGQSIIDKEGTVTLKEGAKLWPSYRSSMKDARIKSDNY